ncbi:hypothetical protein AZE42_05625 [Rhizopogon vesiculosus]|uniref:Uncharacterized protein n=1 Tax=Rhizopogon vesiculosus TaxID=180088 RepID=A0A1J8QE79_9AGAM|nr:hypothetical protein AZE42_05625 [Rhizopogon vesiculosus]
MGRKDVHSSLLGLGLVQTTAVHTYLALLSRRSVKLVLHFPPGYNSKEGTKSNQNSLDTDLFDKLRFPTTAPTPPTSEAPGSSPILKSSSPLSMSSSPVLKSGLPTVNHPPPMTTMSDEHSPIVTNSPGPRKRQFQYSLLPDDEIEDYGDLEDFPAKRSKRLLTSFICKLTPETSVYFTQRMLELSRVSHRTFAA